MTEIEQQILQEMQQDLPITSRPFHILAGKVGVSEGEFLAKIKSLRDRGIIREVNAVLRHRRIGYQANALCVWQVDEGRIDEVGNLFAGLTEVTHCYERESCPDWQYNLYTMVHAVTKEACEKRIREMSELSRTENYLVFYSTQELKKITMRYFR